MADRAEPLEDLLMSGEQPKQSRQCGPCRVCCTLLPLFEKSSEPAYEIAKAQNIPCLYLCADGCAMYESALRPMACRTFQCLWKSRYLREDCRPDEIGLLCAMEALALEVPDEHERRYLLISVRQTHRNAMASPKGSRLIAALYELAMKSRLDGVAVHEEPPGDRILVHLCSVPDRKWLEARHSRAWKPEFNDADRHRMDLSHYWPDEPLPSGDIDADLLQRRREELERRAQELRDHNEE